MVVGSIPAKRAFFFRKSLTFSIFFRILEVEDQNMVLYATPFGASRNRKAMTATLNIHIEDTSDTNGTTETYSLNGQRLCTVYVDCDSPYRKLMFVTELGRMLFPKLDKNDGFRMFKEARAFVASTIQS